MHLAFQYLFTGVLLVISANAFSQQPASSTASAPALPASTAGKRVDAYLKAFNSGDESLMRQFFLENVSSNSLQRIPMEARLGRFREMHSTAGSFQLVKVLETADDHARIVVDTAKGMRLRMEFQFEKAEPHKLLTIGLDEARPEDEGVTPMQNDASLAKEADQYVAKLAQADDFSGVVMVAKNGSVIFQKACGYANREEKIPNAMDTRFNLGSINKSFTQVAIHQLAARGKLSFTNSIKDFLPDYPNREAAAKVTVKELLDMTSGIGDFFGDRYETAAKEKINSIADYLPLFADKPLEFQPGTRRRYSNGGYIVLGAIIEKVTGTDYYNYVRSNIFAPAKMAHSDWFPKNQTESDIAVGYTKMNGPGMTQPGEERRRNSGMLPQRGSSAGGGYSSAPDLLNYIIALETGLAPETFDGRNGFGIAGGTEGVNAALDWDPHSGYAVIVLSNYDPPIAETIAHHLRALLPQN
jgi:D-alanyl-D-alanine carboxypeptidase